MQQQYEVSSQSKAAPLPLFNLNDIHTILSANIGLRLTPNIAEFTQGGRGDAVPLSHLAGAQDSILFISLSSLILRNQNLDPSIHQQHLTTLQKLFTDYAGHDPQYYEHTAPVLMLVYAALLGINTRPIDPKLRERRLPAKEEELLIKIYQMSGTALFPIFIFDRESQYYGDLPSLRLHLTTDFNQLLEKRLQTNLNHYTATTMHYLLISSQQENFFARGYDWHAYPMGKAGTSNFTDSEVVSHVAVTNHNIAPIWTWLKEQCSLGLKPVPKAPSYFQQGAKFCQENKAVVAGLIGLGMFGAYKLLEYQKGAQDDHTPTAGM